MLSQAEVYDALIDGNGRWCNHIDLAQWADVFVIAPATANTISKMSNGSCDNIVLATYLSYPNSKPLFIAPAMDADMYQHSVTRRNIENLSVLGYNIIPPVKGFLASGIEGVGRMEDPERIVEVLEGFFQADRDTSLRSLRNKKVVVSYGGTKEFIDPVRYIGNSSSGKMGEALVDVLLSTGAQVTVIYAHTEHPSTRFRGRCVRTIGVVSSREMHQAVLDQVKDADMLFMVAAVSDYTIETVPHKIKKSSDKMTLHLTPVPDILASVAEQRNKNLCTVGFALETAQDATSYALKKLISKGLDMIVLNKVGEDTGPQSDTNEVMIFPRGQKSKHISKRSKAEVARSIVEVLVEYLK